MKDTNFEKLFNKIVTESKKFNKKYNIIKQDEDNEQAAPEDVIHQDDDEQDQDGEEDGMYQNFDISEMNEVTPEEAEKYIDELKEDDDIINNTLIMLEQIFYKVTGVNDEDEIPSNPKFQEFVEELRNYCQDEWGYDWDEIQDEQEMLFYALGFVVNKKKDLFESEEEWKKFYVLFQCEYQESQSIIYPTWQQGRGILDFFLQYFDSNSYDEDDQDYDEGDQNTQEDGEE